MDSKEVRARALDAAVRIGAAWKMESAGDVVALAFRFEQYINGNDTMRRVPGTVPIKARPLTPEEMHSNVLLGETVENIWGAPCATCGHSTGVHFHDQGCAHPDGCECAWPDTSAPECGCTHRAERHGPEAGCVECKCTWTGSAPAPEPTGAPGCECGHPKSSHSGAFQGCDAWVSRGQVCSCTGYAP